MNEQEKARELVGHFEQIEMLKDYEGMNFELAKQCALICVEEIVKNMNWSDMDKGDAMNDHDYWQNVKSEINEL